MKYRPILFSGAMVRAILAGHKTQTRRVVKHKFDHLNREPWYATGRVISDLPTQPGSWMEFRYRQQDQPGFDGSKASTLLPCPYGQPGDRLWVRETFADLLGTGIEHRPFAASPIQRFAYAADTVPGSYGDECRKEYGIKWKPSIHMPRAASRITLEITGVRVERLQDISDRGPQNDCTAEGVFHSGMRVPTYGQWHGDGARSSEKWMYKKLWESINGQGSWEANPWVWVIEFRRVEGGE